MWKSLLCAVVVAALTLAASAAGSSAFEGGWYVDDNPLGREILYLGDNSDNTYRKLRGTLRFCGKRGHSYATVRGVMMRNGNAQLTWWVVDKCDDGYVRVCMENRYSERACSTYIDQGWVKGD